jgi:signal peptide peptidase SppA
MLREIYRIYDAHVEGKEIDFAAIEAQIGKPLGRTPTDEDLGYYIQNGVAVVPIDGVISKKMTFFKKVSGGASVETVTDAFKTALDDPMARAILLKVDSPGGSIDGIFELAAAVFAARDVKPIVSLAYGTMASAAYLIGSAASAVYASDKATAVGSIGVVYAHRDKSALDAKAGVITTEIYRGKYKRLVTDGPLTEEGRAHIEAQVDYFYSLFVNEVAQFRGCTPEQVLSSMSTDVNDLFIGEQAIEAGLIDGIAGFEACIEKAMMLADSGGLKASAAALSRPKDAGTARFQTLAELEAAYPDYAAQLRAEGRKQADAEEATAQEASAQERVLALLGAVYGTEAANKVRALATAGTTAEQFEALKGLSAYQQATAAKEPSAELKRMDLVLAGLRKGAETNRLAHRDSDYLSLVDQYMAENGVSKVVAMVAVMQKHPEKHEAYLRAANSHLQRS